MSGIGQDVLVWLPVKGGGVYPVTRQQADGWREAFPAVDVDGCLRAQRAWLDANPDRRKTVRGMPRFIVSWLLRESQRPKPAVEVDPYARFPRYGAK